MGLRPTEWDEIRRLAGSGLAPAKADPRVRPYVFMLLR